MTEKSFSSGSAPTLLLRTEGSDHSLPAGRSYVVGRDPECDIVITDGRVSRRHAVLRLEDGRWLLQDNGSSNGTYAGDRRVDRIEVDGECQVRLGHPTDGPVLSCTVSGAHLDASGPAPDHAAISPVVVDRAAGPAGQPVLGPQPIPTAGELSAIPAEGARPPLEAPLGDGDGGLEIPYAVRWLVPKGERFANFDILNDNDTQLDYYRRFGHIYAVGIPTKKWRMIVVSDPELLHEVAADEEQFGKRVEEINFFTQLSNSRGGGISVIGDGDHYDRIRRVMLPWYAPLNQRTQLAQMKEQARKLVDAWSAIPDDEPVDARNWMERYTLEVSGRAACNFDFGLLGGNRDPHPFAVAVPESTKESIRRVADPRPDFTVFAGPTQRALRKRYRRHNEELFRTAGALVSARMHTCPHGQPTDLLSRLVSTPDPETGEFLDAETMRDQILMHLSNGFNGPSITGAWLAYLLATHPDVEEKLIAEIDGITGGDPDYDLQYDDLMTLPYTTQVIKETMRIYPPMPVTIRRSLKDGMLGRYRVRRGDIILVGTLAAQRDPRYWGPDPDRFDPELLRDGEGARPATPRLHPVLDREAAVHGARGHLHDAPRCPVRDLQALPAAARAGRDGDEEHDRDDEAGRGSNHPFAARGEGAIAASGVARPPGRSRSRRRPRVGRTDGDTEDERLPSSRDRVRQQFRREQGTGRALRGTERLPWLHERCDHAERARRVAAADAALGARRDDLHLHFEPAFERDRVQVLARAHETR